MAEHPSTPDSTFRARHGSCGLGIGLRSVVAFAACAIATAFSSDASAQQTGATVLLPISGIRVPVPGTAADWKVSSMRDQGGSQQADVLQGNGTNVPNITLVMRVSIDPLGCSLPLNKSLGSFPAGTKEVTRPSYLPRSFEPKALESPLTGGKGAVLCATIPKGDAVVKIVYKGPVFESAMAKMKATLDKYATEAARLGPAAQGKSAPSPSPAPAPTPAPAPLAPPVSSSARADKITLGTAGATIQLPPGWKHEFSAEYQQPAKDLLIRYQGSEIAIVLIPPAKSMSCPQWEKMVREQFAPNARWVQRPNYAPSAYYASVAEDRTDNADTLSSRLCLETKDNGMQEVSLFYGSKDKEGARPAYPLLEQLASSILNVPALPSGLPEGTATPKAAPPPPEPPPPAPAPASPGTTPSYTEDSPPSQHDGARSRRVFRKRTHSPWVEFGGFRMQPSDSAAYDNTGGGYVRIKDTAVLGKSAIGFAWTASGQVGFDSRSNIPFDLKAGLGFGLQLGPISLIPLVEVGADSAGGGEPGTYKVPAAFNLAAEGVARLHIYGPVGLEGSAARVMRGNYKAHGNSDVPAENRIEGQLKISRYGLGVRFIDFKTARQLAGTLGFAF
jgi:hypothetical protein